MPGLIIGLVSIVEEHYIRCPDSDYVPDFLHRVLIFWTLIPAFAFGIVTFLSWFDRTLFTWALAVGVWINTGLIWMLQQWIPTLEIPDKCVHATQIRPQDDCATMWLIFVYYYVYVIRSNQIASVPLGKVVKLVLLGLVTLTSCYSTYELKLYSAPEVVLGSMIGAVTGIILCVVVHLIVLPNIDKKIVERMLQTLYLKKSKF